MYNKARSDRGWDYLVTTRGACLTDDVVTETDDTLENWVDVRMTDPAAGEWGIDCLVDDVAEDRAASILAEVATRRGLDSEQLRTGE